MLLGRMVSHSITAAARLRIADELASGPKSAAELARAAGAHAPSLFRMLRMLASVGVFAEHEAGRFGNTPLSETLRTDVPGSTRPLAMLINHPALLQTWQRLDDTIAAGSSAFLSAHGENLWDYLAARPEVGSVFNDAMSSLTAQIAPAVAASYAFSAIETLVDVGGGHGLLLRTILEQNPKLRGVLFDLPAVASGAKDELGQSNLNGRLEVIGGDFFSSVPPGDAYLLKHILHDWSDEDACQILGSIHRAAPPGARLLVIEAVLVPGNAPDLGKLFDLEMLMVTTGGRERTELEFSELFRSAGFELSRVLPTPSSVCIVEGVRR
jgi:hypothetical protein